MKRLVLAALAALAACTGNVGTVAVSLTTAPGSTVLDAVQTLRLTLTNPKQVTTATRTSGGFTIDLELPATGDPGALIVDGLDGSGVLVATGASPAFPVGALDARIVIYMAAPNTIGAAPATLDPPRSELAADALTYGAIFAGGRDAAGAPSAATAIYNAYDHAVTAGMALPAARAGVALGVGATTDVYLFGGTDASGTATANAWRFDTSVAPAGVYLDFGDKSGFARDGAIAVPIGNEGFLISGTPAALLSGLDGSMIAAATASLPAAGATVVASDGVATTIFAGAAGIVRFRKGTFDTISGGGRAGASVVGVPGGKVVVIGGAASPDASRIDAAAGTAELVAAVVATPRDHAAIAATSRFLIVAGGTDAAGQLVGTAEVLDATTLAPVATIPLVVPRQLAAAIALPNGQLLIAGGVDGTGAPIATLELFTPSSD